MTIAADISELLAILLYLAGVRLLAARGRHWAPSSTAAFITGIVGIWVAVGSPLANYDDVSAPVHVVQHALLMMIAPPLIALGRPITLAIQATHRPVQVRIIKVVHSRVVASFTNPIAGWLVYYGAMGACFLDRSLYDFLLTHELAHDASHFGLILIGYLYWQPLIGGDPTRHRLSRESRMLSTLSGAVAEITIGIAIITVEDPLFTHTAGAVFLVLAALTCLMCTTLVTNKGRRPVSPARRLAPARPITRGPIEDSSA